MKQTLSIKRIQWIAIGLMSLPEVYVIVYNVFKLLTGGSSFIPSDETGLAYISIISLICPVLVSASYFVLSGISSNRATRQVTRFYAIMVLLLSLFGVAFSFVRNGVNLSNVLVAVVTSLIGIAKFICFLYWIGTIERNNPECRQTRTMLRVWLFTDILFACVCQTIPVLFASSLMQAMSVTNILGGILYIFIYYRLFISEAFSGTISTEPAPQGAYRFWNPYFKYCLIAILVLLILAVIAGIALGLASKYFGIEL